MTRALVHGVQQLTWTFLLVRSCLGLAEVLSEAMDYEDYDGNLEVNSTTPDPTASTPTPVLTPEAIANITASGAVVIFIVLAVVILFCTFEKGEHQLRIKTALDRNRNIDKQVAFEKRMREMRCEEFRQKQAAAAAANVQQVQTVVTDDGSLRYEEARQETIRVDVESEVSNDTNKMRETNQPEDIDGLIDRSGVTFSSISRGASNVTEVETKAQNNLVNVSLDSYSPLSDSKPHPTVLMVQPVGDS